MTMSRVAKIVTVLLFAGLLTGGAMAQPTDFDRQDSVSSPDSDTEMWHTPEHEGELYFPSETGESTFYVELDIDDSHTLNESSEVSYSIYLYDDSGTEFNFNDHVEAGALTVQPVDNETDGIEAFEESWTFDRQELNNTLNMSDDIGFVTEVQYTDITDSTQYTVTEETYFSTSETPDIGFNFSVLFEDLFPVAVSIILMVVVVKIMMQIPKQLN